MHYWLTDLNHRLSAQRFARFVGPVVFCLALAGYLVHFSTKYGLNTPPTTGGDEADYDSLGWELSHGRGYRFDYAEPGFRAPYEAAAREHPDLYALPRNRVGRTTYRPPLFPLVLAGTNRAFGRQFWAARIVNSACMAATGALAAHYVFRTAGLMPALLGAAVFVLVDYRTRLFGRAILTEAMAALLVALLTIALIRIAGGWAERMKDEGGKQKIRPSSFLLHPSALWAILAGVLAGLAILTRSIIAVWLPGLAVIVYFAKDEGRRMKAENGIHPSSFILHPSCVFLGSALLVLLPWMVRNCLALRAFMPLGVQGMNELSAGYGDEAFEHQGVWFNTSFSGFFDAVDHSGMSSLELERAQARYSGGRALRWIAENPGKALLLAPMKVYYEFRPRSASEWFILAFSLVGLPFVVRQPQGWVFPALVLTCAYTVAVTWSVGGRFLVPLLFVFHVMAAVGVWRTLLAVSRLPSLASRRT